MGGVSRAIFLNHKFTLSGRFWAVTFHADLADKVLRCFRIFQLVGLRTVLARDLSFCAR